MANRLYKFQNPDGGPLIEFMAPEGLTEEAKQRLATLEYEVLKSGRLPGKELPPPSKLDQFKKEASQFIQGAGEIARDVGPGAALGTAGLLTGVLEARGKGPASSAERIAEGARQGMARGAPPVAPPAAPAAPSIFGPAGSPVAPSEPQSTRILQGTTGDAGTTGRARMSGFNVETSQQAARTKQAEQVAEQLRRAGIVSQSAPEFFAGQPGMTSTPSGVLTPRSSVIPPPAKPPGALEEVTQFFRRMAETGTRGARALGGVARAMPVVSYPLAGYSIGEDFGAVEKELAKERPDYADIALRGLGALGTGLSLHPVTAPVGLPLAIGSPLVAASRRKMMADPNKPKMTQEEMEQALPTFAPFP
jgi:hypothetical protein